MAIGLLRIVAFAIEWIDRQALWFSWPATERGVTQRDC